MKEFWECLPTPIPDLGIKVWGFNSHSIAWLAIMQNELEI